MVVHVDGCPVDGCPLTIEIEVAKFRHFILSCGHHAAQVIDSGTKMNSKKGLLVALWECRCKL